jgi:hypothetical protein
MNDSLELALAIGNPTDALVVEALWAYCRDNEVTMADPRTLAGYMVAKDYLDEVEDALAAVQAEIAAGRIRLLFGLGVTATRYDGEFAVGLDDLWRLRAARRYLFWSEMNEQTEVPAHMPNEAAIARAGIVWWQDHYGEAVGLDDLVETVQMLAGYDDPFWALHTVLNAADCDAFDTAPEYDENRWEWSASLGHRCWITDGWLETLDS